MTKPKTFSTLNLILDPWLRLLGRRTLVEAKTQARKRRRSIFIRHVDGGSSNLHEQSLHGLCNPVYDLAQYGIRFVASPRHADVLLLTGPLTWAMLLPTLTCFENMPEPRRVVTMGDFQGFLSDDTSLPEGAFPWQAAYGTVDLQLLQFRKTKFQQLLQAFRAAIRTHIPGNPPSPAEVLTALCQLED